MEWIYKAVVRPKVTYGSLVWAADMSMSMKNRLRKVQRLALVAMTQPLRSAPTAGLEAMMGWLPLDLHAQELGVNSYLRLQHYLQQTWDGTGCQIRPKGHRRIWRKLGDDIIPDEFPQETPLSSHVWHDMAEMDNDKNIFQLHIYTDASKSDDDVGYGWFAATTDGFLVKEESKSAKEIGIYKAEVMAIKEALSWLRSFDCQGFNIAVFSDSLSAVMALRGHEANDLLMRETMSLLSEVGTDNNVQISWVKGHSNVTGNEFADMLANKGRLNAKTLAYATPYLPFNRKQVKRLVSDWSVNRWQKLWDSHTDYRVSRLFMPTVSNEKHSSHRTITELQRLTQIVTGHGLFKRHLRHWNDMVNYDCSLCGEAYEDTWHLWMYCPQLTNERLQVNREMENGLPYFTAILKMFKCRKLNELVASNEAIIEPG